MASRITLHHLNASRSIRIFWVLEELGLEYDVKVYWRQPSLQAPKQLYDVSPFGKAPALTIDKETISESGYIIHRLLQLPSPNRAEVEETPSNDSVFWSHFSEGSQMNILQAERMVGATAAGVARGGVRVEGVGEEGRGAVGKYGKWVSENVFHPQSQMNLDQIEKYLAAQPASYFSGTSKPGIGDFMMFFAVHSLLMGSRKDGGYVVGPATRAWLDKVLARPAAQRAMERLKTEEDAQRAKI